MTKQTTPPAAMQQSAVMVRVSQAKAAFGVHRATLYRWAASDHIRIHKRGSMSFVDPTEVKNFIKGLGDTVGDQNAKWQKN